MLFLSFVLERFYLGKILQIFSCYGVFWFPKDGIEETLRSKNEVVSNLVLRELKHGKRSVRGQARTFVDLPVADTGSPETASWQRWMTGLAGERERWGVN